MYTFIFKYDGNDNDIIVLPIAPDKFSTKIKSNTKSIDLISVGEATIIKDIPLREFSFKVLLPRNPEIIGIKKDSQYYHEPFFYLAKIREFRASKKPIRFTITRVLPDKTISFSGNLLVTIESYDVEENAGETGDYWVSFKLKEFKDIKAKISDKAAEEPEDGIQKIVQEPQRTTKEPEKTYTVKSGDSLWKIAKLQLNDGNKYSEIAKLNNIDNPNNLQVGQVLKLQ